jgi:Predicted nucleic acid-binding protein, contains PIN domain
MKYLIDTDIASYYLRGLFNLVDIFAEKGIDNLRISIVSVAELEVLAYKNPHSKINHLIINSFAQNIGILDINRETWQFFSLLKAETLSVGMKKGDIDILIASVAKQHGMILITNNTRHYENLVEVENWIESSKHN